MTVEALLSPADTGYEQLSETVIPESQLAPDSVEAVLALPRFLHTLRDIERRTEVSYDRLPIDVQQKIVLRRLRQLVNIARLNPLWRERMSAAGLPNGIHDLEDFQAIPLTDKETFYEFFAGSRAGMVVPIERGGFEIVASGGTSSGKPSETVYSLKELLDTYELSGEFIGRHMMLRYLGENGPRWVATTLADYQMWSSGTMVGGVLQKIPGVNYIGAGPMSREVYHLMMSYPGAKAIMGITQSIALLASFAEGMDSEARNSFRVALYGSGVLRKKVQDDLRVAYPNISILSYFAATQAEAIGLQLEESSNLLSAVPGLHFIEVVDADGRWVAEGEEGELVVTRLHANEAPVFRYKIGDRVIRRPNLTSPLLNTAQFEFVGRSGDFMHIGDTQYNVAQALENIAQEFRKRGILNFDEVAAEIQFLNYRERKELRLLVATSAYMELLPIVAQRLGPAGAAPIIIEGLIRSLSVFNSLEANDAALRRTGYSFGLRLIAPSSPELVRTDVGKVPLLVDVVSSNDGAAL
jgi:phenylacetate-coenzyme A ligase PaaK-like adenylate-forming protein